MTILDRLPGRRAEKLKRKLDVASEISGSSAEKLRTTIMQRAIAGLPNRALPFGLPDLEVAAVDRVGTDLMRLELKRGRTFFGHRSEGRQYLWHQLMKPVIPKEIDGDAFKLALDVQQRYFGQAPLPAYMPKGGTFIEGGCYTGLKAMAWHDACEGDCRVVAVEIGAPNVEIMRMNIEANGISAIEPVHAGLWRENGEMEQKHAFTTRRFLEQTDRWAGHMKFSEKVETQTIDTLLDRSGIDVADYMNIQVNGAEIEVLKGFRDLDRIKVLGVAAYYSQDGRKNVDAVRELMVGRGCRVISESRVGRITLVTPKWKDTI